MIGGVCRTRQSTNHMSVVLSGTAAQMSGKSHITCHIIDFFFFYPSDTQCGSSLPVPVPDVRSNLTRSNLKGPPS